MTNEILILSAVPLILIVVAILGAIDRWGARPKTALQEIIDFAEEERQRFAGWRSWEFNRPRSGVVEIGKMDWPTSRIVDCATMRPEFNVANLYWRPWSGPVIDGNGLILDQPAGLNIDCSGPKP